MKKLTALAAVVALLAAYTATVYAGTQSDSRRYQQMVLACR